MNPIKNSIQVVNTFTGEVTQFDYTNIDQLKNVYLELKAMKDTLDRAEKKMKADLEYALGNQDQVDFADGYRLKRQYRTTKQYRKEVVAKYLDEDQMDVVTKVDGVALKALIKELNEEKALPAGAWQEIDETAISNTSSFIQFIKSVK